MEEKKNPRGQLILRTLAMPGDTNPAGDIFGGWIMAQMDIAGGILAKELTCSRIVTVAVDSMRFFKPVRVGDTVGCYGQLVKIGTTSITINLEVWVRPAVASPGIDIAMEQVTAAAFTYVAVDENGKKKTIPRECVI